MNNVVYVDFAQKSIDKKRAARKIEFTLSSEIKDLFNNITSYLTTKQYSQIMGGDMSYQSKALRIKKVTTSKKIHNMCDQLIQLIQTKQLKVN